LGSITCSRTARTAPDRSPLRFSDEDLAEELSLLQGNAAEAHQFERAEEDGDQLVAAAVLQEPLQAERRLLPHLLVELVHLVRDLVDQPLQLQRLRMVRLVAVQRRAEGVDEIEETDVAHVDVGGFRARQRRGRPRPDSHAHDVELRERLRHRLEALVFEQTIDELLARIFDFSFVLVVRQEHLRLDVDQQCRHVDVIGGHVEAQLLHGVEITGVLLGDESDGDVVDVDLVLLDQVQQQVERPVKRRQRDVERACAFVLLVGGTVVGRLDDRELFLFVRHRRHWSPG
jgi:hypothetical protein